MEFLHGVAEDGGVAGGDAQDAEGRALAGGGLLEARAPGGGIEGGVMGGDALQGLGALVGAPGGEGFDVPL